jgi:ribosomal protein S2
MIVIQDKNVNLEHALKFHHHPNVITIPIVLQDTIAILDVVSKINVLVITIVDTENNVKMVNAFNNQHALAMLIVHMENHAKTVIAEYGEKFL